MDEKDPSAVKKSPQSFDKDKRECWGGARENPRNDSSSSHNSLGDKKSHHHHGKSFRGLVGNKPCREIYRPPSLRKGRGSDQSQPGSSYEPRRDFENNEERRNGQFNRSQKKPFFNVYAKEFQYPSSNVKPNSRAEQIYYDQTFNSSSFSSLKQSKSSGSLNFNLPPNSPEQKVSHQSGEEQLRNHHGILSSPGVGNGNNKLQLSKSIGNMSDLGRSRVRFEDEEESFTVAEKHFPLLNLNGEGSKGESVRRSMLVNSTEIRAPRSEIPKNRTSCHLNFYHPPATVQVNNSDTFQQHFSTPFWNTPPISREKWIEKPSPLIKVKRSRSFGSGTQNNSNNPQFVNSTLPIPYNYSDFKISLWPQSVQESVISTVTGLDRVAARQKIDMVNKIFDAMLSMDFNPKEKESQGEIEGSKLEEDLISAATHIFLYFIQREKERTVLESLSNNCFSKFQLFHNSSQEFYYEGEKLKWSVFLKFLSTFYLKAKVIRSPDQLVKMVGEMKFSLLGLLCDSCLAVLRSQGSYTPTMMECLFTVMTSIGRDIEGTMPLKMKQILAAVRDTLLGISHFSPPPNISPAVQKTLMQLIELHAANWVLPASAVRYYYNNN